MISLTQKMIDQPGRFLRVKDTILPVRKKTFPEDPQVFYYERYNRKPPLVAFMPPLVGAFECKHGDRSECIPGESIIAILRKNAKVKNVTITEAKPEGRGMRLFGKTLLIVGSLYFAIHIIIYLVRP